MKSLLLPGDYVISCLPRMFTKVPSFHLEGKLPSVQGSLIRLIFSSQKISKLLKPVVAFLRKMSFRVLVYLDDFLLFSSTPSVPRFHCEPQEILSNFKTSDHFPRVQYRLKVYDNFTPNSESAQNSGLFPSTYNLPKHHFAKSCKANRPTGVLSTSHLARPARYCSLADGFNKWSAGKPEGSRPSNIAFTDILAIASHIPGRDNVSAVKESRVFIGVFKDMSE